MISQEQHEKLMLDTVETVNKHLEALDLDHPDRMNIKIDATMALLAECVLMHKHPLQLMELVNHNMELTIREFKETEKKPHLRIVK